MRSLGISWLAGLSLGVGYVLASALDGPGIVVSWCLGVVAALAAVWCAATGRSGWRACTVIALVVLACTRGSMAGHASDRRIVRAAHRGPSVGVATVDVVGAGRPGSRCTFVARERGTGTRWLVAAPPTTCPIADGEAIAFVRARAVVPVAEPGGIDPIAVAHRRGADASVRVARSWRVAASPGPYWGTVARLRDRAWRASRGHDTRAFLAASILGMPEALPPPRRAELRRAGLGHLIAVSGLHVGLAGWLVVMVAMRCAAGLRVSPAFGGAVAIVPVVAYVGLTGASPPAVRAAVMLGVASLGAVVGRPVHGLTTLGLAVAAILAVRPQWAVEAGFHLSVVAMAVVVSGPGQSMLRQTWRITWALVPLTLLHFGTLSPYAIVSNLVALPVFTAWVLPTGLVGWGLHLWIGDAALAPAALGAHGILDLAAVVARWPEVPPGALAVAAALGLVAWTPSSRSDRRWVRWLRVARPPLLACAATLVALAVTSWPRPVSEASWVALGHPRRYSVVVLQPPHRAACLIAPGGAPQRWPRLLSALGVVRVVAVVDDRGGPHLDAIIRALERRRMWTPEPTVTCHAPDRRVVRRALLACRSGGRASIPAASVRVDGADAIHCFDRGRWRPRLLSSSHPESSS